MSELSAWDENGMNHQGNPGGSIWNFVSWQTQTSGLEAGARRLKSQSLTRFCSQLDWCRAFLFTHVSLQNVSIDLVVPLSEVPELTQHFCGTWSSWMESPPEMRSSIEASRRAWTSSVPLLQRRLMVFWAALDEALSAGWGRWSFPSILHSWGLSWSALSSSGLLSTREACAYWRESNKGPWTW